ncbi:unnamed protein product [Closterium sp. Yama58-4]|nr:unnamed protein product [Closterium sp. Yama58-4]
MAERALGPLIDVVKEAVLAAVREEMAAHKEEVNELRNMLTVVEQRNGATAAAMEENRRELIAAKTEFIEVKRELIAVKMELITVKGALAEHKQSTALQLEEAERRRVVEIREMRGQVEERERELTAELAAVKGELARERDERRREVQEVERRRSADLAGMKGQVEERERKEKGGKGGLAAVLKDAGMEMDVEGVQTRAWEVSANVSQGMDGSLFANVLITNNFIFIHSLFIHHFQQVKTASEVTDLILTGLSCVSDAMLAHVSTMTHLRCINMTSSSGFSAEGIKHLYRLPWLQTLDLNSAGISDSALEGIGSLSNLKELYLSRTKLTNAGLAHLTGLPSLKVLWFSKCKGVTDASMVHVGRLTGLETLLLEYTAVTDDGLQQLTALTKHLTSLQLPNGKFVCNSNVPRWIGR